VMGMDIEEHKEIILDALNEKRIWMVTSAAVPEDVDWDRLHKVDDAIDALWSSFEGNKGNPGKARRCR